MRPKVNALFFFFVILLFCQCACHAQTLQSIKIMDDRTQACLDKGERMLWCARIHYGEMDSVLNMAYNNLKKGMTQLHKDALKNEELEWLKKRDLHFKSLVKVVEDEIDAKKNEWGEMGEMVLYEYKADYIKERVIVLIKRLNNTANK